MVLALIAGRIDIASASPITPAAATAVIFAALQRRRPDNPEDLCCGACQA